MPDRVPSAACSAIYDVAIVGAGVCGTALLHCLSHYTNVQSVVLLEKEQDVALINSQKTNNSQTLHFGDIETNYTLEKATQVNRAASLVKHYILKHDPEQQTYSKYHKMVLAVGEAQTVKLKERHDAFKILFPALRIIGREEILQVEPKVLDGRDPNEPVSALFTPEGYTIDYHKLSQSFLGQAKTADSAIDVRLKTSVSRIEPFDIDSPDGGYRITTPEETIMAKAVAVTAGAHSLLFAKSMGYGKDYALLSVAGSFYTAPSLLNGKVYTVQLKKLPFAAIHGDPEVHNADQTRFGPTAKVLPMLERRNYATVWEYFKTAGLSWAAFRSFFNILSDWVVLRYILLNLLYDVPWIGKRLFIKKVRQIVPSIALKDLAYAKGYGGVRPQIVNLKTRQLELGEAKITGDRILFNITPSPGASTCLKTAADSATQLMGFLGEGYYFDQQRFFSDLGSDANASAANDAKSSLGKEAVTA